MFLRFLAFLPVLAILLAQVAAWSAPPPSRAEVTAKDVLQHLSATTAWYEHVISVNQSVTFPQNALMQDNVRQTANKVVQTAFDFGRTEAAVLRLEHKPAAPTAVSAQSGNLAQSQQAAADRVQNLQTSIDNLDQQIAAARGRERDTLVSKRDVLKSDLSLAKEIQSALQGMATFATGSEAAGGLIGQINLLAASDSIPEALTGTSAPPAAAKTAANNQVFRPENAGILQLIARTVSVVHARGQINSLRDHTSKLQDELNHLRAPLRAQVRDMVNQSDQIVQAVTTETDPNKLAADRQQISQLAPHFKLLSAPALSLGEQAIALETLQNGLIQWRNALDTENTSTLGYLGFRLGALAIGVIAILIISEAIRRMTFRYVHDTRRRTQFVLLRRFVAGFAIAIVLLIGVFNGFGSFATIAGFVTAGLAVALQNVILSVVAYFFLIGRYGLRAGDRVTVSGITGQVIEVGLVRLFLMELSGTGADVHSTGRIAVFSNSIIFQPAALIKQAPGAAFAWHTASVTLTMDNDYEQARKRLLGAVESVYKTYKAKIEQQHAVLERSANFEIEEPAPTARVQFIDGGCQITVRFPVEFSSAAETDEAMMRALMKEIDHEPKLNLAGGGIPKIQPVAA